MGNNCFKLLMASVVLLLSVKSVLAGCTMIGEPHLQEGYWEDYCYAQGGGKSVGASVYNCRDNYEWGSEENTYIAYGCWIHVYECDIPCVIPPAPSGLVACGESAPTCGGYCASGACRAKVSEPNQ
jgi:hypothetical protein